MPSGCTLALLLLLLLAVKTQKSWNARGGWVAFCVRLCMGLPARCSVVLVYVVYSYWTLSVVCEAPNAKSHKGSAQRGFSHRRPPDPCTCGIPRLCCSAHASPLRTLASIIPQYSM